ncbi:MAG: alanine racemase [Bacteroidales bacterium]|nr:alanine racemase [Bacteroidales bacterium]
MVKKLTLSILAFITKGELIGESRINTFIDHILFDSRRLNGVKGTCFFAFQSASDNGMRYLSDLYRKGVRMFVVNKTPSIIYPDASYLVVEDTLRTLQLLASSYRRLFNLPVCGITGSNGKTIVKDWIVRLIENDKQICSTIKSYNSQIGVPLCVYELKNDDDLAIFEAGISKPDEMDTLRSVIQPNIGIFTNIGDAHQVNFSSREEKINEKLKLFTDVKTLIFHDSDALLTSLIESFATSHQIRLIAFGNRDNGEYINQGYYYNTDFLLSFLTIPFSDSASIENALLAYLFCRLVGIDKKCLQSRIRNLEQLESRFEIKSGINNSLIVNDSYSCDLKSLEIALDFLSFQPKTNKIIILSDIQQVSSNKKELYSQVNNLLINKRVTSLIAIGPDFCQNQSEITVSDTSFFLTVRDFLLHLKRKDFANKAVLIKGSAKMDFDLISESLCDKKHRSVLEINLTALTDNVRYFRQKLSPSTLLMAMVKADSYGTGAYQVAYTLQSQHLADCLAVAFVDEGVELRQKGITLPVLVMTPEGDKDLFKEYDL